MVSNDNPVRVYINNIFSKYESNVDSIQLKEEIIGNLNDKINEYLKQGLDYTAAFEKAKTELGDVDGMLKDMFGTKNYKVIEKNNNTKSTYFERLVANNKYNFTWLFVAIYLLLGFIFDLWYIAWVIIPLGSIWASAVGLKKKLISSSPFAYVIIGFLFNAWAFGWVIIPLTVFFASGLED